MKEIHIVQKSPGLVMNQPGTIGRTSLKFFVTKVDIALMRGYAAWTASVLAE